MKKESLKISTEYFNSMIQNDFARPITGYEKYYITRDGRVISTRYVHLGTIIILRTGVNKWGYEKVDLSNKNSKTKRVHRLVAETFIPNINNYRCVNHKNEIKTDNTVDNLEWCSNEQNNEYGTRKARQIKAVSKPVSQIDDKGCIVKVWSSAKDAGRNGYTSSEISLCARGLKDKYRGFHWRYI